MTEKARIFLEKLSADEALQSELTAVMEGVANAEQLPVFLAFAKKKGYELTEEDLMPNQENIDLAELDTVSGGGACGCALYGQGKGDGLECVCPGPGKGTVNGMKGISTQGGCWCWVAGAGATRRH